jgi:hypothetical protein
MTIADPPDDCVSIPDGDVARARMVSGLLEAAKAKAVFSESMPVLYIGIGAFDFSDADAIDGNGDGEQAAN